jgi:hypothetical protein
MYGPIIRVIGIGELGVMLKGTSNRSTQTTKKKLSGFLVRKGPIPADDCHLSAMLLPTLVCRGVSRGQRNGCPLLLISVF